jgi:predicted DNA-binding transcriptional regulator YafY
VHRTQHCGQILSARDAKIVAMADPAGRLLHLLSLLQLRPDWGGEELADRLDVTTRTVRRDVDRLRTLGYPVEAVAGVGGGYRLGAGAKLPPLLLDDDEAVAVAIGLRTAAGGTVSGMAESAVGALAKLEQVLPDRLRQRVRALDQATQPLDFEPPVVDQATLVLLAQCCRGNERVRLTYTDGQGATGERTIEPFRLVPTGRRWYLVARDVRRDGWRTFRVDRIADPVATGHRFVVGDEPDVPSLVSTSISVAPYAHQAVVRFDAPAADVARRVPPTVGHVEPHGESACILRTGGNHLPSLLGHLIAVDLPFEVLEPPELRALAHAVGERLRTAHSPSVR